MSRLLLDVGNSRLKWAFLADQALGPQYGETHRGRPFDEVLAHVLGGFDTPSAAYIANVAGPGVAAALRAWLNAHWPQTRVYFAQSCATAAGVINGYDEPARLGVDRWLALIGAYHAGYAPCCVVDCGTAVTLDCLAADGAHQGGFILPGLYAMRQALGVSTHALSNLALAEGGTGAGWLGRDTQSAVKLGTVYALVAALARLWQDFAAQQGRAVECLLTGGDAPALLPWLNCRHMPDLVLQGLAVLASEDSCD